VTPIAILLPQGGAGDLLNSRNSGTSQDSVTQISLSCLVFSDIQLGYPPMIETVSLEQAADGSARMMQSRLPHGTGYEVQRRTNCASETHRETRRPTLLKDASSYFFRFWSEGWARLTVASAATRGTGFSGFDAADWRAGWTGTPAVPHSAWKLLK
jgi:hypothetical protein